MDVTIYLGLPVCRLPVGEVGPQTPVAEPHGELLLSGSDCGSVGVDRLG